MELHRFFRYAIEKMCKEKKSLNHFNIKNITMEKTFTQICELFDQFSKDANLQMEKGNKAAGTRARKVSLELEKLLKQFRKESLEASK